MAGTETPCPEALAAMVDAIRVFFADHGDAFGKSEARLVESLPSRNRILHDMDDAQRDVLYRSVKHLWKGMSGSEPEFESQNTDAADLDGAYWMMPGGVLLMGFNHFQAAKDNRILVCSLLNINPLVFEQLLASGSVDEIVGLVLARGGVRVLIDRGKSEVVMQTGEESWPWVKDKLERMWHKNKIAKIVDLSQPYEGWKSGIVVRVK